MCSRFSSFLFCRRTLCLHSACLCSASGRRVTFRGPAARFARLRAASVPRRSTRDTALSARQIPLEVGFFYGSAALTHEFMHPALVVLYYCGDALLWLDAYYRAKYRGTRSKFKMHFDHDARCVRKARSGGACRCRTAGGRSLCMALVVGRSLRPWVPFALKRIASP